MKTLLHLKHKALNGKTQIKTGKIPISPLLNLPSLIRPRMAPMPLMFIGTAQGIGTMTFIQSTYQKTSNRCKRASQAVEVDDPKKEQKLLKKIYPSRILVMGT